MVLCALRGYSISLILRLNLTKQLHVRGGHTTTPRNNVDTIHGKAFCLVKCDPLLFFLHDTVVTKVHALDCTAWKCAVRVPVFTFH